MGATGDGAFSSDHPHHTFTARAPARRPGPLCRRWQRSPSTLRFLDSRGWSGNSVRRAYWSATWSACAAVTCSGAVGCNCDPSDLWNLRGEVFRCVFGLYDRCR